MTSPITWSLPARVVVSEAVCASRLSTVPPSPCSTWMISWESVFTSSGDSAWNSGRNPLNSTVRSSAGLVRSSGITPPGGSTALTGPGSPCSRAM